jgi:hypothetical protein
MKGGSLAQSMSKGLRIKEAEGVTLGMTINDHWILM